MLVEHRFEHVFFRRERGLELELTLDIRRHWLRTKVDHGIPLEGAQVGLVLRTWKYGREHGRPKFRRDRADLVRFLQLDETRVRVVVQEFEKGYLDGVPKFLGAALLLGRSENAR